MPVTGGGGPDIKVTAQCMDGGPHRKRSGCGIGSRLQ